MCLAIPGKVTSISGEDPLMRSGKVDFGGVLKEVSLAYVPEVNVGDYVIVLGLSSRIGICAALNWLPLPDFVPHPIVSWISILASILTLSLITVTAGMYPAQRATDMTPRSEEHTSELQSLRHL